MKVFFTMLRIMMFYLVDKGPLRNTGCVIPLEIILTNNLSNIWVKLEKSDF